MRVSVIRAFARGPGDVVSAGEVVEVDDGFARYLIAAGKAEQAPPEPPAKPRRGRPSKTDSGHNAKE